jgi:hypothetical protein
LRYGHPQIDFYFSILCSITHPLNCELMPHTQNNKKKTNSSITYKDLVILVDEYEKLKFK